MDSSLFPGARRSSWRWISSAFSSNPAGTPSSTTQVLAQQGVWVGAHISTIYGILDRTMETPEELRPLVDKPFPVLDEGKGVNDHGQGGAGGLALEKAGYYVN